MLPNGAAYGLTEFYKNDVRHASLIANPGCYPTAALLALMPLAQAGRLDTDAGIVIDAKSGISGAGRVPSDRTHFCENHGSVAAYGVLGHRHVAEMEQELRASVTFVPHLVPLDRGILETIYVKVAPGTTAEQIADAYQSAYVNEPFVRLTGDVLPEIKHVAWTNFCNLGWRYEASSRRLVIVACLDNLVKGAAGSALAELQRRLRLRRADGTAVTSPLVLKLGGELLESAEDRARLASYAANVVAARPLVLIHGAGRAIDAELARRGITPKKVDGLRVTDGPTLDAVVAVLAGTANTELVATLVGHGVRAVGLTGVDAELGRATRTDKHRATTGAVVDLGLVGDPVEADASLVTLLLSAQYVPVDRQSRHRQGRRRAERQCRRDGLPDRGGTDRQRPRHRGRDGRSPRRRPGDDSPARHSRHR